MLKEIWNKIKTVSRQPRPVQYKTDANGKPIQFKASPPKSRAIGKHQASKPGFKHSRNIFSVFGKSKKLPTNHERVIASRARKQGISVAEYKRRWCS